MGKKGTKNKRVREREKRQIGKEKGREWKKWEEMTKKIGRKGKGK